jgi:hypothetical protein
VLNDIENAEAEYRRKQLIITGFLSLTVLLGLVTLLFFVMGMMTRPPWFTQYAGMGLVGLGVGLLTITAWITDVRRFYGYAGLAALIFAATDWLDFQVPYAFIGLGALILLAGLEILRRFVSNHPKIKS